MDRRDRDRRGRAPDACGHARLSGRRGFGDAIVKTFHGVDFLFIAAAVSAAATAIPGICAAIMIADESTVSLDGDLIGLLVPMVTGTMLGIVVLKRFLGRLRSDLSHLFRPYAIGTAACLVPPVAAVLLVIWLVIAPAVGLSSLDHRSEMGIFSSAAQLASHSDSYTAYSNWLSNIVFGRPEESPRIQLTTVSLLVPPIVLTAESPTNSEWGVSLVSVATDRTVSIRLHKTGEILTATERGAFRTPRGRETPIWLEDCDRNGERVVLGGLQCIHTSEVFESSKSDTK